jgi:hypothetical protein
MDYFQKMTRKYVLVFKYTTWNTRGLGETEEELDKILNENNIKILVTTERKRQSNILKL